MPLGHTIHLFPLKTGAVELQATTGNFEEFIAEDRDARVTFPT